jgi:serine/threonine protein kinase
MPLSDGRMFAGYRVLRLLGSGGMGEVYLAKHPRLPRLDALKVLRVDVSANAEYRARFEREADLASTLWHPNIVGVHDRGEFEHQLWISMDYIDGSDAGKLLRQAGMPSADVCAIATAVASALDYAHKRGLLHRDIKPANIMITHDGDGDGDDDGGDDDKRILLADFGVARAIGDVSGLTETNMTVGTVAYCAPEQLMGEDLDGRADQYALAASCYQLLTGATLFPHSNAAVVISRHLNADPPSIAASKAELAPLDAVLRTALAKNPDERFSSASEFAMRLCETAEWAPSSSPVAATVEAPAAVGARSRATSRAATVPTPSQTFPRYRILIAAGAVTAVVAVAAALLWRPWETRHTESTGATSSTPNTMLTISAPPVPQAPTPTTASPPPQVSPPAATQIVTAVAVDASGQPAAGYTEAPASPNRSTLSECSMPSVSAVNPGIYSCYPFAASATTCWPSPPDAMLCLDDPWEKRLTRFEYQTSALPSVQPTETPQPLGVVLGNGSKCAILIGGARGRSDGYLPTYGCDDGTGPPIVIGPGESGGGIERTTPTWTAWVADLNEPMQAQRVVTAIFAG